MAFYCTTEIEAGDIILSKPVAESIPGTVVQVSQVKRVVYEDDDPYVLVQLWYPVMKINKFQERVNHFGTWTRSDTAFRFEDGKTRKRAAKRAKTTATDAPAQLPESGLVMMGLSSVLVWPIRLQSGEDGPWDHRDCGVIPLEAFEYVRTSQSVNLALKEYCFSDAGGEYHF